MDRPASGSSTRHSLAAADSPSASADSRSDDEMSFSPVYVVHTMGSRL
jgi:hypothetical protein